MEHPTVFASLSYDDVAAAIDFLVDAFGGERHAVYYGDDGSIRHAEIRFGNGIVMFGPGSAEMPATRGSGRGIYVVVADPDAHCARARQVGADIAQEPHDTDYDSRAYSSKDLEGNTWHFGTYQPFAYEPDTNPAKAPA